MHSLFDFIANRLKIGKGGGIQRVSHSRGNRASVTKRKLSCKKLFVITVITSSLLSACAVSPKKIEAIYVSPLKYAEHDCDQIALEMDHIGRRTQELYRRLKHESDTDRWQGILGLLVFWPSLLFLEGKNSQEADEYARMKGEYEALRQNAVEKKCSIQSKPPEEIMKESLKADREADESE